MRTKRASLLATLGLLLTACGGGEAAPEDAEAGTESAAETADPTVTPAGEPTGLPAGYALTLDREGQNPADFRAMEMDGGVHIQTGPAGVFYNPTNTVTSGDYSVSATFTEVGAPPNHREALGLIIGGSNLDSPNQQYTYFLVRADGQYLIKKRAGSETSTVVDWTASDAVNKAAEQGDVTNALEVAVRGDHVHFSVNGTEVAAVPAAEVDTHGVAGVRVNHNLNVMVSNWTVTQ